MGGVMAGRWRRMLRRRRRAGVVVVGAAHPGQGPWTIDELEALFVDVGGRSRGVRLVVLADPADFLVDLDRPADDDGGADGEAGEIRRDGERS